LLKDLISKIISEDVQPLSGVTSEFNDFISKLLQKDPVYRINWDEIKNHPWWESKAPQPNETYK